MAEQRFVEPPVEGSSPSGHPNLPHGDRPATTVGSAGYARRHMDRKTTILAGLPIFAGLEPRSMEAVATLARIVSLPADTVLLREGETAESFYIIVSGTVHIERAGRFIRSMSAGGFLGEIALVEGA